MLPKLPAVIAIEFVIALLSFLLAGDKVMAGEIYFAFTFLIGVLLLIYIVVIKIKDKLIQY